MADVRLYLANVAAAVTPTAAGTWTVTASGASRLAPHPIGVPAVATTNVGTLSFPKTVLLRQWVSDPIPKAGTLAGNVRGVLGYIKSAAGITATINLHIRVITSAGTARGNILANTNTAVAITTTATGLVLASTALSSLAVQVDDRIVVELGYRATAAGGTGQNASVRYGFTQPDADTVGEDLLAGGTGASLGPLVRPGWLQFTDTNNVLSHKIGELVEAFDDDTTTDTFDDRYGATSVAGGLGIVQADRGEEDYSGFMTLRTDQARYSALGSSVFTDVRRVPLLNGGVDVYASFNLMSYLAGTQGGFRSTRDSDTAADARTPATMHMSSQTAYFDASGVDYTDGPETLYRRIRVEEVADPTAGGPTVYWDTAPEASGGVLTWTNRRTLTNAPSWWRHSDLNLLLEAHGDAGTPADQGEFGGVNVIAAAGTEHTGAAAFAGDAAAVANGVRTVGGAAAFSGESSSAAAGVRATAGTVAYSGVTSLAAAGVRTRSGAAVFAGTSTAAAAGVRAVPGAAAMSAVAVLSVAGAKATSGTASYGASATLTAAGARVVAATAVVFSAQATAVAAGRREIAGAVELVAIASLYVSGGRPLTGAAVFAGTSSAAAAGVVQPPGAGSAEFSARSILEAAAGTRSTSGAAAFTAAAAAAATGRRELVGAAAFAGTAAAAVVGELVPRVADFVHLTSTVTAAAAGDRATFGAAAFASSATSSPRGTRAAAGTVELSAAVTLVATPAPPPPADRVQWPDTGVVAWPDTGAVEWPDLIGERWIP